MKKRVTLTCGTQLNTKEKKKPSLFLSSSSLDSSPTSILAMVPYVPQLRPPSVRIQSSRRLPRPDSPSLSCPMTRANPGLPCIASSPHAPGSVSPSLDPPCLGGSDRFGCGRRGHSGHLPLPPSWATTLAASRDTGLRRGCEAERQGAGAPATGTMRNCGDVDVAEAG